MIDPNEERLIGLAEAGRMLAIDGRELNPATIWRWTTSGRGSRGPKRIRLETIRVGGRTCTSREALARFLEALNPQAATTSARSGAERSRASDKAARALEKVGI